MSRPAFSLSAPEAPAPVQKALRDLVEQLNRQVMVERSVAVSLRDSYGGYGIVGTDTLGGSALDYVAMQSAGSALTNTSFSTNTLRAVPFLQRNGHKVSTVAIIVNVAAGAGGKARLGIYDSKKDAAGNLYPNRLRWASGEIDTTAAATKTVAARVDLEEGHVYWVVHVAGTAAATLKSIPVAGVETSLMGAPAGVVSCGLTVAFTYAALPQRFPGTATLFTTAPIAFLLTYASGSSILSAPICPGWVVPCDGYVLRRAWLVKGTATPPVDNFASTTVRVGIRNASSFQKKAEYTTRTGSLFLGSPVLLTGDVDLDVALSKRNVLEAQVAQTGWPKVSMADAVVQFDVACQGGS